MTDREIVVDSSASELRDSDSLAKRRDALKQLGPWNESSQLRLRDDLRIEEIDGEVVVLDQAGQSVHRMTGEGVAAVRLLELGVYEQQIPPELAESVKLLVDAGLVADQQGMSRRRMIAASGAAALAAATVTTFALADPAAAWTRCSNGKTPTGNIKYTNAGTYTWTSGVTGSTGGPGSYSVLVRAWGGGGGGGDDDDYWAIGGSGGGGGAYASSSISVTECTDYTVVVGAGGAAKTDGGNSTFNSTSVVAAAGKKGGDGGGTAGAGGSTANSTGATKWAGGTGGTGGLLSDTATGGGSAGSGGNGGNGGSTYRGAAGTGTPPGAQGGDDENGTDGSGYPYRDGQLPGGGGAGDGGKGGTGAVWIGY